MNIELKPREKQHVVKFWNKTQDAEIRRLFPFSTNSISEAILLYEQSLKEGALSYGKVIYYNNEYIGDIWCYGIDEVNEKMAMLSIVIFEKYLWKKGIGTTVIKEFISDIYIKYNIDKIGAFTYLYNYGSISLLKKVGFKEVEVFMEDGVESVYLEYKYLNHM